MWLYDKLKTMWLYDKLKATGLYGKLWGMWLYAELWECGDMINFRKCVFVQNINIF